MIAPRQTSAVLLLLAAACAPAASVPGTPAPVPASPRAVVTEPGSPEVAARLLRLEDRREYDGAALESAATSASSADRRRAALAAGRIRDKRALPLLGRLLADVDTSVAATAAFALGQVADSAAVPLLAPYATAQRVATAPTVVGEAALALGKIRTPAARSAVESFLLAAPSTGTGVREAVSLALLSVYRFPRPADPASILPWLESQDTAIRWRAAYALTRRPDPRGTGALFPYVTDPDALVRSFAIRSLTAPLADSAGVSQARALPVILAATRDADHAVSVSAVRALGTYAAPESIAELERLLGSPDAYLAITAAESLGRLAARVPGSAGALRTAALNASAPVALRTAAIAALAEVAPAQAREVAGTLAREPGWRIRAAAARAYAEIGDREAVAALARDPEGRVSATAIEAAVGAAGDTAVAPIRNLLIESLGARDVIQRTNALGGLGKLADPATLPVLVDA